MANVKLPDALARRHLLEGKLDAGKSRGYGEAYLEAGREIEARPAMFGASASPSPAAPARRVRRGPERGRFEASGGWDGARGGMYFGPCHHGIEPFSIAFLRSGARFLYWRTDHVLDSFALIVHLIAAHSP